MVKTYRGDARNNTKSTGFFGKWSSWRMYGGGGSDTLTGGNKNDTIYGGGSSSEVFDDSGDTGDKLDGGKGNDYLYGGWGNDTVIGGWGNDTVHGGSGNDTLEGNSQDDRIYGGLGHDYLDGGAGNDTLDGGSGNDWMRGGYGSDTYYVDSHLDRVFEEAPRLPRHSGGLGATATIHPGEDDKVFASTRLNNYTLPNNVEHLTLYGRSTNRVFLAFDNDADNYITNASTNQKSSIYADKGDDTLMGASNRDTLSGGSGDDVLVGGAMNDDLRGGANKDTLVGVGGAGSNGIEIDRLEGGSGADKFYLFNPVTGADYVGNRNAYAILEDFNRNQGDTIHVERANVGQYTLGQEHRSGYADKLDTVIYFNNEMIGLVKDNTNVRLSDLRYETTGNQLGL